MSTSFNTKRRKDKTHKKAAAPSATTDDDKTKKKGPPKPPPSIKTTTFQEKIALAHRARNVKSQKQMFMDVVLSKEFGT